MAIPFTYPPGTPTVGPYHPAELSAGICDLTRLLDQPVGTPHDELAWRAGLGDRLAGLRAGFADHIRVTEGPEGLYAELVECAPRLVRAVGLLVREHDAIGTVIDALCDRVADAAPTELRRWVRDLVRALSRHRQRGADLVYDALERDIGGET